jgi:hypothetical protein
VQKKCDCHAIVQCVDEDEGSAAKDAKKNARMSGRFAVDVW